MTKLLILAARVTLELRNRVDRIVEANRRKYRNNSDFVIQAVEDKLNKEENQ
jgi:Arc/MetJ-type ribon-helix-helix transcriptional regulator